MPEATTAADVSHLWRRAAFGISAADAEARAGRPWADLVAELVDPDPAPMPRPPALDDPALGGRNEWWRTLMVATTWVDHMTVTPTPGAEKLTWFWHGFFPTSLTDVVWGEGLFRQLTTLRSRAQGPFRALLGDVAIDGAMAFYLDNVSNVVGKINENLGRELLELFSVGVGNFSQADVVAAARCLTGHNVDWSGSMLPCFYPQHHDDGEKVVLGVAGTFDAAGLVDVLCSGDRALLSARNVARRLWSVWAYAAPSATLVDELARTALADGATGRSHARAVLLHPEFRSDRARTELVRTPLETVVAMAKVAGTVPSAIDGIATLSRAGQLPFTPPNVGGWPAARSMTSVGTFWETAALTTLASYAAAGRPGGLPVTTGTPTDAARSALRWAGVLEPAPATVDSIATCLQAVRGSSPASEPLTAAGLAFLSPDFAAGRG
jgi:hypothetical protein